MNCAFTEAHYREIILALSEAGYRFSGFSDFQPGQPLQVILRHDVDLSLEDALRLAQIDAALGARSVFHFLLTAQVYNPMCATAQSVLDAMRRMGHRIGLHVDVTTIADHGDGKSGLSHSLCALFDAAREILGPLDSYSVHRVAASGSMDDLQPDRLPFAVPPYAYAPEFFQAIPYRSDSRREWHQGCICSQLPSLAGSSLQLLIHPIWWPARPSTRGELLRRYLKQRQASADDYLAGNLSFYRPGAERLAGQSS